MAYSNTLSETANQAETAAPARAQGAFARAMEPLSTIARNMFALDYRSLALLRIAMGLCLLWVVYISACEMRAFYTDEGVLPRSAVFENADQFIGFSLHFANGSVPYIATLFGIQFVLAFMLVVGYRTRLAIIGSYILLLSMQDRQPVLLYGADGALRLGLFWMMFLPLAERFSLDRLAGRARADTSRCYLGVAGLAFILQVCIIYTFGALMKSGPTWHVDHTAVAYALATDAYSRPLGHWLGQFHGFDRFLTVATLFFELYGPALFILPLWSKWGRLLGIALFAGLQIGFGLCMTMGHFGPVMIALTLVFLPAFFWERIAEPLGRKLAQKFHAIAAIASTPLGAPWRHWIARERSHSILNFPLPPSRRIRAARITLDIVRDAAVLGLLAITVLWNLGHLRDQPWRLTPALTTLGRATGISQMWDMFAPDPNTTDGWFVVAGTLHNGQTVDLMTGASPVSYDRPASVAGTFKSTLWMSYLSSFWTPGASSPDLFTTYLGKTWNEHHSGGERIDTIEFSAMVETVTLEPDKPPARKELIWVQAF
ncbi:MAG: HTTM domain-containing protein [Tepidisphaeraceae bacterium]|jgi:hypothetical protein